jgi:hypothetical protein
MPNTSWYEYRTKKLRINDEVITAKSLRKDRPDITWSEALRLAKQLWDKVPII